jgi:tRNA G18 (ribose-2'-O)-methylase SpoU
VPQLITITDPADPRVDAYRAQKDAWLRARHRESGGPAAGDATGTGYDGGLFMAEGALVLRQLAESRYQAESLLVIEARLTGIEPELKRLADETPVYAVSREIMEQICGFDMHRGILCAARRGIDRTAEEVMDAAAVLVVLEDLSNHDNVGGIFRSAAALAGPDRVGVLLSPRCCDPLYRKAIRVSMGWALRVPFATIDPWPQGIARLHERGWTTLAMTPGEGSVPIGQIEREPGTIAKRAILIGAEGPGLSDATLAVATRKVRIPIHPAVDSLNAMVSASIAIERLGGVGGGGGGLSPG